MNTHKYKEYLDMKKSKRGSVLIFTLIVMMFLIIILTALSTMTLNGVKIVNTYNGTNSAYYVAESGLERVKYIAGFGLNNNFFYSNSNGSSSLAAAQAQLDQSVNNYISTLTTTIATYQGSSGKDSQSLTTTSGKSGYYIIKSISMMAPSTISGSSLNSFNYNVIIQFSSEGHFQNQIKTIDSELNINYNQNSGTTTTSMKLDKWQIR
jgi:type IV pilus assembly protein PilX